MDQVVQHDVEHLSDEQLDVLEREIASKYMRMVPWGAVFWGLGNFILFLAVFPLVFLDVIPLWAGFLLACLCTTMSYLPSHEAQHNIIAGKGRPLRWLNELVGQLSVIPIVIPYRVLRATHMEHHAHTNHPEKDPDYGSHADSTAHFFKRRVIGLATGDGQNDAYGDALERTGQSNLLLDAVLFNGVYLLILFGMAWSGYALEAVCLWWLPRHIGLTYLSYYLSWAPHHPGEGQVRYEDTRAFRSRFGNLVSMGMQYHIVHHLYPRIPLSLTPAAYRELRPILARRGCDLGAL